jgi:hypothetical protein
VIAAGIVAVLFVCVGTVAWLAGKDYGYTLGRREQRRLHESIAKNAEEAAKLEIQAQVDADVDHYVWKYFRDIDRCEVIDLRDGES